MKLPKPYYKNKMMKIYQGSCIDILKKIPDNHVNCCVTSPPYWGLRDYGTAVWSGGDSKCDHIDDEALAERMRQKKSMIACGERCDGSTRTRIHDETIGKQWQYKDTCKKCGAVRIDKQIGLEKTLNEYINKMIEVLNEVKRILKRTGTLWLNMGDSYINHSIPGGGDPTIKKRNIGTTQYTSTKVINLRPKNLIGLPWRIAFALQEQGWYLRQDIIWSKPNPMPESVTDRCTKSHEYIFLLSKAKKYYFDNEAIKEPVGDKGNAVEFRGGCYVNNNIDNSTLGKRTVTGNKHIPSGWDLGDGHHGSYHRDGRKNNDKEYKGKHSKSNRQDAGRRILKSMKEKREESSDHDNPFGYTRNKRSVWTIATKGFKEAHFAVYPPELIAPCILAGCPEGGIVLDPFAGALTTNLVAAQLKRKSIGIELNGEYINIGIERRIEPFRTGLTPDEIDSGQMLLFED